MLPKDILSIIGQYDESGIFVVNNESIFWFNAKRLEYWCETENYLITSYCNDLYGRYNGEVYMYKNRKWEQIKVPQIWKHPLYLFRTNSKQVILNDVVYRYDMNFERFDGKEIIELPTKIWRGFGISFHFYKNDIYYFGSAHNEKFSIIHQKWTEIATTPISNCYYLMFMYLFNNKFYYFVGNKRYCYDPEIDEWQLL